MASFQKLTKSAIANILRHDSRIIINNKNTDIDKNRTHLNYSFPMSHQGKTDYQYYKDRINSCYLYGKGSVREDKTITACSLVVTLPKELSGYSDKEHLFFSGVYSFVSERYGESNIINNVVHYDEAGQPHIHIVFVPATSLNHDQAHYKTKRSLKPIKLESGRYEYEYRYVLKDGTYASIKDYEPANGQDLRIPIKNYAKASDAYDTKISAADVLNKAELQHFHQDLQDYLNKRDIKGNIITGTTGSINISVDQLKDITRKTGLTLEDIKKQLTIDELNQIMTSGKEINLSVKEIIDQERNSKITVALLKDELNRTKVELDFTKQQLQQEIENNKSIEKNSQERQQHQDSGWGTSNSWNKDIEEDRVW